MYLTQLHSSNLLSGLPQEWKDGPLLEQVPYPDVFVKRAVSHGDCLSLCLSTTTSAASTNTGVYKIGLSQLKPGKKYRVLEKPEITFESNKQGKAKISVLLLDDSKLTVQPVN